MNNTELRKQFNDWHKAAYEPALSRLSKDIGITRSELTNWKNNKVEFGEARLIRVKRFLGGRG